MSRGWSCDKNIETLKNEENFIRVLNLFKNNLTDESIKVFSEVLLINKNLEEITEEYEEYKRLEKERQDIIKQNAKLKASKKPELEVPYLDEVKEVNGEFFRIKNDVLKVFNLIQNNFTEKSFEIVIKLLDGNRNTVITIEGKSYTDEQKAKLKDVESEQKYRERVFLLK